MGRARGGETFLVKEDGLTWKEHPEGPFNARQVLEWKKQAETLRFLFGDEGVKTANLMKVQIWREKAERWDQYAIYDNDNEPKILVKDLITAYEQLEAVKTHLTTWVSGHSDWQMGRMSQWKKELDEILEAEG